MAPQTEIPPDLKSRVQSAETINRAMARFPLLVQILRELDAAPVPHPGDDELWHGCDRALTTMLAELAWINPAAPGVPSEAEALARSWLNTGRSARLIDADKLRLAHQFIDRILGDGPG